MASNDSHLVTGLLQRLERDPTPAAEEALWTAVYEELRAVAARLLAREVAQTLHPTAVVGDAYLRLFGNVEKPSFENRRHFFGAALRAMRQLLIEQGRRRQRQQQGGGWQVTLAPSSDGALPDRTAEPVLLAESLDALEAHDARAAQVVMLRFFAGLPHEEVAQVLGVSIPTVKREWAYGRAWLFDRLAAGD